MCSTTAVHVCQRLRPSLHNAHCGCMITKNAFYTDCQGRFDAFGDQKETFPLTRHAMIYTFEAFIW